MMAKGKNEPLETHVSGQSNIPLSRPAHALTWEQVVTELDANGDVGLEEDEAKRRLEKLGANDLGNAQGVQPIRILIRQIANAMTLVLILAMVVSFAIKSWIEGGVVSAVILLNIVVGFIQEFQAERTMDSLRSLSSPTANAIRHGRNVTVPTADIVPGDMVEMKTGDTIPADVRLIEAVNFETDEALLTGESLPVHKNAGMLFEDHTGPGDRLNVAYSSSTVTKGRARGIVFATGLYTEIGSIAAALRKSDSNRRPVKRSSNGTAKPHRYAEAYILTLSDAVGRFLGVNVGTPLQKKLSRLAVLLFWIAVVCALIVLGANKFSNKQEVVIYAVATGLSMIPASLIVVLTITMAAGTQRMVQRHVIVRNLRSLEALGAVTDICSDKTGTLTQGKMIVRRAWIPSTGTISISTSQPFDPTVGHISLSTLSPKEVGLDSENGHSMETIDQHQMLTGNERFLDYLTAAALANLASVRKIDDKWYARGDPTEVAIQVFASRFGHNRLDLASNHGQWSQVAEFPFDSDVKKMSVIFENKDSRDKYVFTKGAVERVLDRCVSVHLSEGDSTSMTEVFRDTVQENMKVLADQGLRVLALASKKCIGFIDKKGEAELDRDEFENELTFQGLIGLYDPPRPESAASVRQCHHAGIQVHMLTGDHPGTAEAIAREVGIVPRRTDHMSKDFTDAMVMTASAFDRLSADDIDKLPVLPLVVARCSPNTKVRMIEALHRRRKFVAMTGDGVNDSPSLKKADVGIAMGQSGSDVAKDASDIVLTDDNFASIINAIEEGRRMFDNIQKFILHLLAENIAQACTLLIGLVFKDASNLSVFPLAPVEILWVIMITSGMPDMGLGFEQAAPEIMDRPPQNLERGVFTLELMLDMLVYGLWTAALCIASFVLVLYGFGDGNLGENCNNTYSPSCDTVFRARATCFACLTWFALFLAWEMVHMRRSFFHLHPRKNKRFTGWITDIWQNQFLFWAIIAGFVTIFPTLYIPVINRVVFKHKGISWEWGIVFIEALLFFLGIETWKWAKRIYFRRKSSSLTPTHTGLDNIGNSTADVESNPFSGFLSPSEQEQSSSAVSNQDAIGLGSGEKKSQSQ